MNKQLLTFDVTTTRKPPRHLADYTVADYKDLARELGVPPFRVKQIATHYYTKYTDDPADMSDLPKATRDQWVAQLLPDLMTADRVMTADGGRTIKTAWKLFDNSLVESVVMRYPERVTLCLSSQAGCGMNCPFCATGQAGLTRNLSAAEIVDQAVRAAKASEAGDIGDGPARLSNVVFMGMGEPLANYRPVVQAVRALTDSSGYGLGLSARSVTVSTVGLVPAIDKLADESIPVTLALSLHAPDDELRDELVPINTRWTVSEALDAARRYFDHTGRRISIEYALIRDINDQAWRARLLARELNSRGQGWAHVNPIPLNPTPGSRWTASDPVVEEKFVGALRSAGITTTVRDTRGRDIDGACGQLAAARTE